MQIPDTAFTHGGKFHADDVFSAALLKICNPNIAIQRGFAGPQGFAGLVFDIGDGPFDHHAKNSPVRENGVPYAAFGLLWRELGPQLIGPVDAGRFDESFVQPLDLDDNTGCGNQLANIIAAYNPRWDGADRPDDCFAQAVALAQDMLAHKLEAIRSVQRAAAEVNEALGRMKRRIVRLSRFAPWKQQLIPSKARFVVYPSQRGGWAAQAVPASFGSPALKVPFPAHWAGASEQELPGLSGIETLRFCHAGRFLVTAGTEEDAVAACEAAMELNGEWIGCTCWSAATAACTQAGRTIWPGALPPTKAGAARSIPGDARPCVWYMRSSVRTKAPLCGGKPLSRHCRGRASWS